jgi:hypothetical protein
VRRSGARGEGRGGKTGGEVGALYCDEVSMWRGIDACGAIAAVSRHAMPLGACELVPVRTRLRLNLFIGATTGDTHTHTCARVCVHVGFHTCIQVMR